jgi:carbonic anhydrase/acetyltransferase-like protein (isoleucine patch superfamily)
MIGHGALVHGDVILDRCIQGFAALLRFSRQGRGTTTVQV